MSSAYTNYLIPDYEEFGRGIGSALALVYIGPAGVNKLSEADRAKLKDMIELSMYPSLTEDVYMDEDNKAYLEYLVYLMEMRDGDTETQKPDLDDIIVPSVPALRDITHEEME